MRMNKVLALVVAAAMGLSSAAFAAETATATPAAAPAATATAPPLLQRKRFTIRNTTKPLQNTKQLQKRSSSSSSRSTN
jgi:hypothetical protein